jgi:hypothetical protein
VVYFIYKLGHLPTLGIAGSLVAMLVRAARVRLMVTTLVVGAESQPPPSRDATFRIALLWSMVARL